MYQNFNDYLVSKFNKTVEDCTVDGIIETVLPMGGGEENRIVVFYPKGMLSLSVFYGNFEEKHQKAIYALVDTYNECEDRAYELRTMNNQIWVEVDIPGVDDQKAIEAIEKVIAFFTEDGEFIKSFQGLKESALARWKLINKRAQTLRERACILDNNGYHEEAMEYLKEICELYYGYKHMELISMYYRHDFEKTHPAMPFPHNEEYALECLLLAIENDEEDVYEPIITLNLAQKLGREDICKQMERIGQERGSWEKVAFVPDEPKKQALLDIANFYRQGIGCPKSERNASYYDRLASGERQEVLKDMLTDGFDRVFLLMNDKFYYQIQSLSGLDGLSDEFKSKFLYGDEIGECKLTPWFVPLMNGLNEQDRDLVLAKAKEKMELDIETLSNRAKSGEIEVVTPADKSGGVLLEDGEKWRYIYPVNLTELVDCEAKDKLLGVFGKFKDLH